LYTTSEYGEWTIKATAILGADESNESPFRLRRRIKDFTENVYNADGNNREGRRQADNDSGDYIDVNYKEVEVRTRPFESVSRGANPDDKTTLMPLITRTTLTNATKF